MSKRMDGKEESSINQSGDSSGGSGGAFSREDATVLVKKSMLDGLLNEIKSLKQSLGRKEDDVNKYKRAYRRAKHMFKDEWPVRKIEWKLKRLELKELKKAEEQLETAAEELKKLMGKANLELRDKELEVQELTGRIKEIKSGNGSGAVVSSPTLKKKGRQSEDVPVTAGGERKDAMLIFPEEIWKLLFEHISDPADLWNLCNTCKPFDDILHSWKTGWMLEESLPYLYRHIPSNKIVDCLLVSKSWYAGLHNFLENHPSLRPHAPGGDPRRLDFVNPALQLGLSDQSDLTVSTGGYMRFLHSNPNLEIMLKGNPFMGRYVRLRIGDDYQEDDDEIEFDYSKDRLYSMWESVQKFLEDFGKQIYYLSFQFAADYRSIKHYQISQDSMRKYVQLVTVDLPGLAPNLRKLRISGCTINYAIPPNILPSAPNLDTLEFDEFHEDSEEDPVIHALLRAYHNQLRKLRLTRKTWRRAHHLGWPQLTDLYLIRPTEMDFYVLRMGVAMPSLTKLGVNLSSCDGFTFDALLELINGLARSTPLTTLRLEGYITQRPDLAALKNLYAPLTLKTLEIDHCNYGDAPSYTFLLRCFPLIENLHLFVKGDCHCSEAEVSLKDPTECRSYRGTELKIGEEAVEVNKYIYSGQMYRSNVWALLPQLKVFSFQWDVYTRDGYEEYLRKKEEMI